VIRTGALQTSALSRQIPQLARTGTVLVMVDSENESKNQHKKWSDEDWRLLMITFAGGLASIIVGAGILGSVVILARIFGPGKNLVSWLLLTLFTVCGIVGSVASLRSGIKTRSDRVWMGIAAFLATFGILILVGIAAGIK
jgi:hypothetical protein